MKVPIVSSLYILSCSKKVKSIIWKTGVSEILERFFVVYSLYFSNELYKKYKKTKITFS